ncbi:MAG: AI-2E family transporter [Egibacteraceae bacterium]
MSTGHVPPGIGSAQGSGVPSGRTDGLAPIIRREPWLTPGRLLGLIGVLLGAYATLMVVRALRTILVMLAVSLFLSFAMEPAVQYLGRRGWRRGLATMAVFLGLLVAAAAMIAAILPLLIGQVAELVNRAPQSLDEAIALLSRLPLPFARDLQASPQLQAEITRLSADFGRQLQGLALGAAGNVVSIGAAALGAVFRLLTVALLTFYLVADGPRFRRTLALPLPPGRQRELLAIWELAVAKTGGYVYSRVLLAIVCAAVNALVLLVIGVPYPMALGLWVGITSAFVPVVGTYLGGVLVVIVAAIHNPVDIVWVVLLLVGYQQVENYLIAPRIQARTMDVHPAVAFISVIIGGTLLGAVGALLALPATAIIQALLTTYIRRHELITELEEVPLPVEPRPQPRVRPAGEVGA